MGAKLVKFKFIPKENEQLEATIRVPEEKRSVIHGVVVDSKNRPVKDAVVKLFIVKNDKLCPITHSFTDKDGQFLFGPLCDNKTYVVKVWFNDVKIRDLTIKPEPCEDECLHCERDPKEEKEGKDDCYDCGKYDDCE